MQLEYTGHSTGRFWEGRHSRNAGTKLDLPLPLLFADLVAMASSVQGLAHFKRHLAASCQRWGLLISFPTQSAWWWVAGRGSLKPTM